MSDNAAGTLQILPSNWDKWLQGGDRKQASQLSQENSMSGHAETELQVFLNAHVLKQLILIFVNHAANTKQLISILDYL